MYIRLLSGSFDQEEGKTQADQSSLEKKALLVYTGKFNSMDGEVDITDKHIKKFVEIHNASTANLSEGEKSLKHYPPIQLDHSTSAKDTVGRLVGPLVEGEHVMSDGKKVKALYGTAKILGKENVEKVNDGRWTHLSIGADLETGKINELTITPFPAAPNASLLKGKTNLTRVEYEQRFQSCVSHSGKSFDFKSTGFGCEAHFKTEVEAHKAAVLLENDGFFQRVEFKKIKDDLYGVSAKYATMDKIVLKNLGGKMFEKLMKFLTGTKRLTEDKAKEEMAKMNDEEKAKMAAEAEEEEKKMRRGKLKEHLMKHKKMSEEDAEKHLAGLDDEKMSALETEKDEHEKKMAAEENEKSEKAKMSKLSAAKASITKLSSEMKAQTEGVQLSVKKAKINVRLSGLQASGKITPAEIKKMDLAKLSAESDATVDAVLKTYADREPVILTGVYGSTKGVAVGKVYKSTKMSSLEKDMLSSMPFTRMAMGLDKEEEAAQDTVNIHVDTDPHTDLAEVHKVAEEHMAKAHLAMDAGNHGEAKEHLRKLMEHYKKHMGAIGEPEHVSMESTEAEMSSIAQTVEKLQTQNRELLKLVEQLAG